MTIDKVIITNLGALKKKYGNKMPRIERAISRLRAMDRKRRIDTELVALDSPGAMEALQAKAVMN
ncbi:MAG: hypothetical protein R6X07_04930, partial [Desulfatiglandales bacterium]